MKGEAERVVVLNLNQSKASGRDGGGEDRDGTLGFVPRSREGVMERVKEQVPNVEVHLGRWWLKWRDVVIGNRVLSKVLHCKRSET